MTRKNFIKINLLASIILISINIISYDYLSENISLILSFKPSGVVRSNVSKIIGMMFIPLISLLTIFVGLFQETKIRLKHITYLNIFLLLVNIIIIISNQL